MKIYDRASIGYGAYMTINGKRYGKVAVSSSSTLIRKSAEHYKKNGYSTRIFRVTDKSAKHLPAEYFLFVRERR